MTSPVFDIQPAEGSVDPLGDLRSGPWTRSSLAELAFFHPASGEHRPRCRCRALYDANRLYWSAVVEETCVLGRYTSFQDPVCEDSCVEFFFQPAGAAGYFNVEVNCLGATLVSYVEDPTRTPDGGLAKATLLSVAQASGIRVATSLAGTVCDPELPGPLTWRADVSLTFDTFAPFCPGFRAPQRGDEWRGNFYKCAEANSEPHWASWAPIGEALNFHVPGYFGLLRFR